MRVRDVEATLVSVPLGRSFSGSSYAADRRNTVIVTVRTTDGVEGRIHAGDEREHLLELGRLITEELAPIVVGRDATAIEPLWRDLMHRAPSVAHGADQALYVHALSAIDTALWDALAKRAGLPTYRLWGGDPAPVPTFVIGGYYLDGKTLDDLVDEVVGYRQAGFGGLKLKVGGGTPEQDLERLAAVRAALGPDVAIACDANQGWRFDEAVRFAEGALEHDLAWFEEPIVWYEQYRDLPRLRARTPIPVCAGQSEHSLEGAARLITTGCVDICNYDASWGGGPTGWRRIAALAHHHGITLAHHEEPHLSAHLLSTVEHRTGAEFFHAERDPVWHDLLTARPRIEDGALRFSDLPGYGLEYDASFIERFEVR
jgi:D-galactarolactone cycloisomerase